MDYEVKMMPQEMEQRLFNLFKDNPENGVCRICLEENDNNFESLLTIKESSIYLDRLKTILTEDFQEGTNLPHRVCKSCEQNIIFVESIITKWRYAQRVLTNVYLALQGCSKTEKVVKMETELKMEMSSDIELDYDDNFQETTMKKEMIELEVPESLDVKNVKEEIINNCNNSKIVCHICDKSLKSKNSLEIHIKRMHGERKSKRECVVSGFGSERRYHCMYCEHKAKNRRALDCHIRIHTGEKPFKCEICEQNFRSNAGLYQHKNVHNFVLDFTCSICGKQFNSKRKHKRHMMVHVEDKLFECDICKKTLKNKNNLQLHIQRHNNIKNYSCETCGATFVSSSELIGHSKIHTTDKKFHCNICKYKSNVKAQLEVHLRRHSGFRPFECNICSVKCYTSGILKVHMRKHTKEKNYPCPVCDKLFQYSGTLNKHVIRSHGIKYKWSDQVDRRVYK